ncbi:MAG: hypothetical protein FWH14_07210 [Oscillospiraceae bacterium]|nr:hypothetical protein [Oscillospiraceae bacterium]
MMQFLRDYGLWAYIAATAIVELLFIFSYVKSKRPYELVLVVWIPFSWLSAWVSFTYGGAARMAMTAVMVIFFILFIWQMFYPSKLSRKSLEDEQSDDPDADIEIADEVTDEIEEEEITELTQEIDNTEEE